ncbi:MAG: acyl-CoA dehydrogenase family protein [Chloroflexi bacterium]|nr:acyl-CoA dehydrogenase family protein [Chloroflexota bacterium]
MANRTELVAAARDLRGKIDSGRAWADEHSRMAPEVVQALRDAGLFTMIAPREVGGAELAFPEGIRVFEELGYSDPSAAWHVANSASLCSAAAGLEAAVRDPIFAGEPGPYGFAGVTTVHGEPVAGGYRVSGRAPFMTGVNDAPWALFHGDVHENRAVRRLGGMADTRQFIVPASDFTVESTWGAARAMRGTGSDAATVTDAFVPEGLARPVINPAVVIDRPIFRIPVLAHMGPPAAAAILVGIARRGTDETARRLAIRTSGSIIARDRVNFHQRLGEATAAVDVYSAGLQAMAQSVWADAQRGELSQAAHARMYATSLWVMDQTRALLSDLLLLMGSAFYASANPVEAGLRDAHAICASLEKWRGLQEGAGRVRLGLDPQLPSF